MKNKIFCLISLALFPIISSAQETVLNLSELPIVKSSERIYEKAYPGAQRFSERPINSLTDFEERLQSLKDTLQSTPNVDLQWVVKQASSDPKRLTDITQTVYLLSSHKSLAYAAAPLNDQDFENIAKNFLNTLDPYHVFFTQQDIKRFTSGKQKIQLKKAIHGEDLTWVYNVFDHYTGVQSQMLDWSIQAVKTQPENAELKVWTPSLDQWPKNTQEQKVRWSESVQDDVITSQISEKDNKLNTDKVIANYQQLKKDVQQLSDLDKLEIFLKSYTEYVDPHSLYLAPRTKSAFSMQITNVLQGVGIVWQQDKSTSNITVQEVLPGGPAARNDLKAGDRLVKIGEDPKNMKDVKNLRLEDVVDQTRGAADSMIYFLLQRDGAAMRLVGLKRETIHLEQNYAEGQIVKFKGVQTLLIKVPGFYRDDQNPNRLGGSVSYDVQQILTKHQGHYNSVVLDLRNNGGGVMSEAVNLVSLFLSDGIGVQVKNSSGAVSALPLEKNKRIWAGPLSVVVNRRSASASEITAAALQDYGRAIIVGETTYGKGTAQTLFDFDEWTKMPSSVYGQINLTTMMFFRPRGASTQKNGVRPDVWIGENRSSEVGAESAFKRALPVDNVGEKNFKQPHVSATDAQWQSQRVQLQNSSMQRWTTQPWFSYWKIMDQYSKKTLKDPRSLVFTERFKEYSDVNTAQTELKKQWEEQGRSINDGVNGDVFLREALNITNDAFNSRNSDEHK